MLGESAGLHGPAGPDDRDPVSESLGLGEDVAGQQHGAAFAALGADESRKVASISGSRPDVGSSRISSSASLARAAISATFCLLPLE